MFRYSRISRATCGDHQRLFELSVIRVGLRVCNAYEASFKIESVRFLWEEDWIDTEKARGLNLSAQPLSYVRTSHVFPRKIPNARVNYFHIRV